MCPLIKTQPSICFQTSDQAFETLGQAFLKRKPKARPSVCTARLRVYVITAHAITISRGIIP